MKLILQLARENGVKVSVVTPSEMDRQSGEANTQGVIAYVHPRRQLSLDELIRLRHPILLIVDHLEDPFNFGAILRSAELFGAKGVIYPKDRNTTLTPGVIKAASGAIHYLDLVKVVNIGNTLDRLKAEGYWIYSTHVEHGVPLPEIEPNFPMVLVVGNEGKGVSNRVQKMADVSLNIPTVGNLESLNVSVATGIALYHFSQYLTE
ncbi:23S rRNA (guanosine(2251)-2'-O)-methyltransferase RlmB [bacterium]|nr:23S rRNA (guanosine(2251)-2'-O)-methyltransferase RlmB [bacterium]